MRATYAIYLIFNGIPAFDVSHNLKASIVKMKLTKFQNEKIEIPTFLIKMNNHSIIPSSRVAIFDVMCL